MSSPKISQAGLISSKLSLLLPSGAISVFPWKDLSLSFPIGQLNLEEFNLIIIQSLFEFPLISHNKSHLCKYEFKKLVLCRNVELFSNQLVFIPLQKTLWINSRKCPRSCLYAISLLCNIWYRLLKVAQRRLKFPVQCFLITNVCYLN